MLTSSVWRGQLPPFSLGLLLGGLVSGTVVGVLGGLVSLVPSTVRLWLLIPALVVLLAFELLARPLSLPQNRRLVPQEIIPRSNFEGPLQFGFELGTGVRTFVPTSLPHALVLTVVLTGGVGQGVLAGAGFALGRLLMPLGRSKSRDPQSWDRVLLGSIRWVERLCAVGFLISVLILLV